MSTPFDPRLIASRFWERAGVPEPFPRQLRPTIAAILPVSVVFMARLTVGQMNDYLLRRGAGCVGETADRAIRGCLLAQRGHAFVFIDGCLPDDEQRFTLAHETAHYLHHYEAPREAALALVGPLIRPVLDGERPPSVGEKLRGALRGVPLGVYEHTLDRSDDGLPDPATARLETEADLIAFELLAPSGEVTRRTRAGEERRTALVATFGLPAWAAMRWGSWLDARSSRGDGLIARLESARRTAKAAASKSLPSAGMTGEPSSRGRQRS